MTKLPNRKRRPDGISRRDFVMGRVWRLTTGRPPHGNPKANATPTPEQPAAMRYPKSLEDVAAGDAPSTDLVPPTAARRRTIPIMRPPGAVDEASFLAGCTRCEECIRACPHDAIVHAPARLREAAGTPMIEADRQPCLMCRDFPCIAACEPNVLHAQLPVMMGTARITEHLCLPHHGTSCSVCSESCPVPEAIVVDHGKPTVNEAVCTGCGVCRAVCPAPENAILLMPTFIRPALEN